MAQPQPPPISNKKFSKTAIIVIAILIVACVALASATTFLFLELPQSNHTQTNNNPQNNTSPDISGVQVLSTTAYAQMSEDAIISQVPYRFHVYIAFQIKNPTNYTVTLRLYGEVNLTLSGDMSGNYVLDNTVDFSVPNYSQADYQIPIFISAGWYSSSTAITAKINGYHVSELWRGIGSPP